MKAPICEEKRLIQTTDGATLVLWKIYVDSGDEKTKESVFMSHGTFSDKRVCIGMAEYLAQSDFICWILEWRDHGASDQTDQPFNFETIANEDISAAVSYIIKQSESKPISFVGHSGAGIALIIYLICKPNMKKYFKTIALLGCQAFGGAERLSNRFKILFGRYLSISLGRTPGKFFGLGWYDEKHFIMDQWYRWNLSGKFLGVDGTDFRAQMKQISIPTLSIAGEMDLQIAPKKGCELFLNALGGSSNKFILCSRQNGFQKDYSHSELMLSRNAKREIWPLVRDWLVKI